MPSDSPPATPALPVDSWAARHVYRPLVSESNIAQLEKATSKPGGSLFDPSCAIWHVHQDVATFAGGIAALWTNIATQRPDTANPALIISDPWEYFRQTWRFAALATFGPEHLVHQLLQAEADCTPQPEPDVRQKNYVLQVWHYLTAYQQLAAVALPPDQVSEYIEQTAAVGTLLGIPEPPQTWQQLTDQMNSYPVLTSGNDAAKKAANTVLRHPPIAPRGQAHFSLIVTGSLAITPEPVRSALCLPLPNTSVAQLAKPIGRLGLWLLQQPLRNPGSR